MRGEGGAAPPDNVLRGPFGDGAHVEKKNLDDAELLSAVLEFTRNTDAWEEMPLEDVRRKLEQQLNLNEGFQICFSHTSFFACYV